MLALSSQREKILKAPWLMFEAGALAKSVKGSRLVPLLFGIESADIKGPLIHFQAAAFSNRNSLNQSHYT